MAFSLGSLRLRNEPKKNLSEYYVFLSEYYVFLFQFLFLQIQLQELY